MFRKTIDLVYDYFFLRGWWDVVKRKSLLKLLILFGAETKEEIESGFLGELVIIRGFVEQLSAVNFALTQTHCKQNRKI